MDTKIASYGAYYDAGASRHHSYNVPGILAFLPRNRRLTILDAGCGNGSLTTVIAGLGHRVVGVDTAADAINIAIQTYRNAEFHCRSVYDDLSDILPPGGVDAAISCEVIEHLYSPDDFLSGIARVVKPGGFLIITTPYHGFLKNLAISVINGWDSHFMVSMEGAHIKFFSRRTFSEMLQRHGFADIQFRGVGRLPYIWSGMVLKADKAGDDALQ
jgi:2-polyprenyl-3-methyl-5-hydroxy-6-metoxy-1,4-benzoquinol methylase